MISRDNYNTHMRGFTLIELVVVIAVIGILAALSIVGFSRYQADTRDARRVSSINVIAEALEKYYDLNGEYPSCAALTSATVTTDTLKGVDTNTIIAPQAAPGTTNSIKCSGAGNTLTTNGVDFFEYQGDGSPACSTGQACLQWTLKYRDGGQIVSLKSRRQVNIALSGAPSLSLAPAGVSQANLSWSAVSNADNYTVQRATNAAFTDNLVTIPSVTTTSLLVSGLTTGTTYYFRVQAVNSQYQGDWSNTVSLVANFTTLTWTKQTGAGQGSWFSVASSSDGTKLAAITYSGYIYTSTNSGATWTARTGVGANTWINVASSSDGTKLVVAELNPSNVLTSNDSGANWTFHAVFGSDQIHSVASSSDGTKLVAGGYPGYIYTSTNSGASWTARTSVGTAQHWQSITSSSDGTKLAAVSSGGSIYTSSDSGASWIARTSAGARQWSSVASSSDGTTLVASCDSYIYISTNSGVTWTAQTSTGVQNWEGVTVSSDGTKLAATALSNYIYTSIDAGATWNSQVGAGVGNWFSVAGSSDGTKLIVGQSGGSNYLYSGVYTP